MGLSVNILLDIFTLLITLVLLISGRRYNRANGQKLLIVIEIIVCFTILFDMGSWYFDGDNLRNGFCLFLGRFSSWMLFLFQSLCWFVVLIYSHYWTSIVYKLKNIYMYLTFLPLAGTLILLIVDIFNDCVFSVTYEEGYVRGKYFWITIVFVGIYFVWLLVVGIVCYVKNKDNDNKMMGIYIFECLLFPGLGTILQSCVYGTTLVLPFSVIGLTSLFLNVQMRAITRYQADIERQKNELQQARISIMMSQIQPHFLYNSLTVIMRLCDTNPKEAKQAIADFSDYLRLNLDSLNMTSPIPVKDELKHTDVYVKFEKLRFGERLKFETDIQEDGFFIPPLTIQPLVENAIKHGVCKKKDGGTVKIKSYVEDKDYCVEVEDDGVGFVVGEKKDDGRTHVGLENVKERIKSMSNGVLEINSVVGEGTKMIIRIPKER